MATILEFRATAKQNASGNTATRGGAEVIIFPGVRYERWEEPAPQKRTRAKPKRDRMEIPD